MLKWPNAVHDRKVNRIEKLPVLVLPNILHPQARATPGVKFGQTPLKHGQHVKSSQRDYDANRGE